MFRLTLALLATATLACQTHDPSGDDAPWNKHFLNADRARKAEQFERAEIELRAAVRLLEKTDERRLHSRALAALARHRSDKREYAAAGSLFEASIDIQLTEMGAEDLVSDDLISDMGQLAMVKSLQQNHAAAESLLARILTLREQGVISLDPIEPNFYQVHGMMSGLARERGLTEQADSLQALAETYQRYVQGFDAKVHEQYPKAQEHLLQALNSGEEVLGSSHPDIARFCRDLSMVYTMQAKHDQAAAMLTRAVAILEQQDQSTALAVALEELAVTLDRLGRTADAEAARVRLAAMRAK